MKLLQKTGKANLLFTSLLLLLVGCLIYFLMTSIIEEEITEKLYVNKERIKQQIEQGEAVFQLPPVVEIQQFDLPQTGERLIIRDTILYDPFEQESELFREVTSVENINGKTFRITVRQVILEPHDYLNSIGLSLAIVLILQLFGLFQINRHISGGIWKPFYRNLETLKRYSLEEDQPIELQPSDIYEFKELNRVIERLTEKIRSDYNTLKEFSENAAHEIQTPLAIILTKLDEMLQDPMLTRQQANLIKSLLSATHRLSKLNKTLLLLVKIENGQFSKEEIDVALVMEQSLGQCEDLIQAKGLTVETQLSPTVIQANPLHMDMLLSNLLNNAAKHNMTNGVVNIELQNKILVISNTGDPLKQTPEKMFERFVKADQTSQSLGLGFAIVKKICDTNHWSISYTNLNEWHVVQIKF